MNTKTTILACLTLLLLTISSTGCIQSDDPHNVPHSDSVQLLDSKMEKTDNYVSINGTIKNVAGKPLGKITLTAKFYDKNDTYLFEKTTFIYNLPDTNTKDFFLYTYNASCKDIHQYTFEIGINEW